MSTYTILPDNRHGIYSVVVEWTLTGGQAGQPIDVVGFPDKTIQVSGTFGGAVTVEGSNKITSPDVWSPLRDPQGNLISFTSVGISAILENPYWIRPVAAAGVSSVVVRLVCAQSRR